MRNLPKPRLLQKTRLAQRPRRLISKTLGACLVGALLGGAAAAQAEDPTLLSLEELMRVEVSSAAKKPQQLADVSTAIYVIGREEIRRSGATSLPEALRLAPGVQVSRIDGSRYAVGIRGFNSRYSGNLLVLLDGRVLYSPMYSGTLWEAQDVVLEDVDRIEVIRGPGGTLWGANAVNGVINIITRRAEDTQGGHAELRAGNLERTALVRQGGALANGGHWRAYLKLDDHGPLDTSAGLKAHDAWKQKRVGLRADLKPADRDTFTVQGDVFDTRAQESVFSTTLSPPASSYVPATGHFSGGNLLLRWQRLLGSDGSWQVQAYADRFELSGIIVDLRVDTFDLDFQRRWKLSPAHELNWGLGFRQVNNDFSGTDTVSLPNLRRSTQLFSAFLQDEIRLRDALSLTLGSKIEHNDHTGVEWQPNARLLWRASATDTVWAAVSRAVQTPSPSSLNGRLRIVSFVPMPAPMPDMPVLSGINGNPSLDSQVLLSREIGYRGQITPKLSLDVSAFYNTYDNLFSLEPEPPIFLPFPQAYARIGNALRATTSGLELSTSWQAMPSWRLKAGFSVLNMKLRAKNGGSGESAYGKEGSSPRYMAQLHSSHNLGHNLELDAHLYYTGRLSEFAIPSHTRLDLRLGWRATPDLELSLTGRHLLTRRHAEFRSNDLLPSQTPPSVLVQARWKY